MWNDNQYVGKTAQQQWQVPSFKKAKDLHDISPNKKIHSTSLFIKETQNIVTTRYNFTLPKQALIVLKIRK